jgi:peptidoglycan/xylan/chitin deacetylase (PgdA/CDA1 family)
VNGAGAIKGWLVALLMLAQPAIGARPMGKVALTFDDLPGLTVLRDQAYVDDFNSRLTGELRRRHIPATGFVNEYKLDQGGRTRQIANLQRWINAGLNLGNHSFSHPAASQVGAAAFTADILRGEQVTRPLLAAHGIRLTWFRHPYLDTGSPRSVRDAIDGWLTAHGYRVAPVTIDADDWEFAEPYDDAIARHDLARQKRIRRQYLTYTAMRIGWSQASARALFGRDIAHVALLHCTRLNADTLEDLLRLFRRSRLRPVGLGDAMRDPAYRTRDDYAGKDGIDWLERWALTLHKSLPTAGDEDPPKQIQQEYDRVDSDQPK